MFLRLHDANDKLLRINMSMVESYGVITGETYDTGGNDNNDACVGMTYIVPVGITKTEPCYVVKETPSQIDNMLDAAVSHGEAVFGGASK